MKLIIGLGNIGKEYENTRHNIGWLYLDYLSKKYNFEFNKEKHYSMITDYVNINDSKVIFAKPTTYMNLSGKAVLALMNWYKIDVEDILIIYDDIDIMFGEVRYKKNSSAGTHNGMKNIVQTISTNNIPRIKLGIGGIKYKEQPLCDFVLSRFSKEENDKLLDIFSAADEKFNDFLDKAKNKC